MTVAPSINPVLDCSNNLDGNTQATDDQPKMQSTKALTLSSVQAPESTTTQEQDRAKVIAKAALKKKSVLAVICSPLQSVTGDVHQVAKVLIPVLAAATLARTIDLPLTAYVFAQIIILAARVGVASLCKDIPPAKKTDE